MTSWMVTRTFLTSFGNDPVASSWQCSRSWRGRFLCISGFLGYVEWPTNESFPGQSTIKGELAARMAPKVISRVAMRVVRATMLSDSEGRDRRRPGCLQYPSPRGSTVLAPLEHP